MYQVGVKETPSFRSRCSQEVLPLPQHASYHGRSKQRQVSVNGPHRSVLEVLVGPVGEPVVESIGARLREDTDDDQDDGKEPALGAIPEVDAEHLCFFRSIFFVFSLYQVFQ